ncbi:MAG: NAD(P)/FAD-dependent oxidoreductase [Abditibacteriales bacterium]|nr:NAD(P)/FAD-dependent oxidoreductase [Abditibacteriales bacterium]
MGERELTDVIIVGGGPVGLFAAFYAGMRQMSVKIIDSLEELGGQLTALYPEKYIYDVAGFPKVKAKDLVAALVEQGLQFGAQVCLKERVEEVRKLPDGTFHVRTSKGEHFSRTVILTAGVGAFTPNKLERLPELEQLEGKHVFYFVKDLERFRNKDVLIVGGGDSAVDWALNLEPIARSVTLIHRRDKWRAHEGSVQQLMASSVQVHLFHEIRRVEVNDGRLERVIIFDNRTQEDKPPLRVDAVILSLGFKASLGPIKDWGLEIEGNSVKVDSTMATNIPGLFAAGDIVTFPGKLKLIATGFGEAATAANYAKNYIDPTSRVFPGHSSNMDITGKQQGTTGN